MFVTIFYGILHTDTGELEFSMGGHNPPYLFSERGGVEMLRSKGGLIVGMVEQAKYTTQSIQMQPGDGILLYTDGVTEAADLQENQFGEERVEAVLQGMKSSPVDEIVRTIFREVDDFAAAGAAARRYYRGRAAVRGEVDH